jgi:hypothetical protein
MLESGDDHANHRQAKVGAGQLDGDGLAYRCALELR